MKSLTLHQRCNLYNAAYPNLCPLVCSTQAGKPFFFGHWFVGGGNISSFYGSYQIEYLERINVLFPDCKEKKETVHLFSGSIPLSPDYTVVGLPDGEYKPELTCNAEQLSSFLPFRPSLILADPPYEEAANGEYAICTVNRAKVVYECAQVLRPGGFLVWMDQALPVFSNDLLRWVGNVSYIRSTANRFRVVSFFQRPANIK